MKRACIILVTIFFLFTQSVVFAGDTKPSALKRDTAASDVVVDVIVTRPIGLVGLITGTAAFILTLPVALATGSVDRTRYAFIEIPYDYTFQRPLGDVH